MPDTVSKERRSEIMSHIKSKNTSIELLVRKKLYAQGYRFRVNYKPLPGKPDIVFTKKKTVIFVHGCFWHGHEAGCRYSHTSQSRKKYWEQKISMTKKRDNEHTRFLIENGWKIITIWECEIKQRFDETISNITNIINNDCF
ncbi:MAG: very short patch repair endonuclease [Chitinispirillales bacterium]|jgi:DNA mismatch endonuclease (patch repair protein)|nr:very short patch repair endonuclease [Chitinispirillales bacterium]